MQNQADLIAQKKREIEEKLAHQHKETTPIVKEEPKELIKCSDDNMPSSSNKAPIPFKNDGSFLEQFKQLQQSSFMSGTSTQTGAATSSVFTPAQSDLQSRYIPPSGLPPINITVPPPSSFYQQQCNPQYSNPPPQLSQPSPYNSIEMPTKGEVKHEQRSPSPYSPSRPCEDEEEPAFINNKDYQEPTKNVNHEPSTNTSEDSGNLSQSSGDLKRKFKEEVVDDESTLKSKEKERKR